MTWARFGDQFADECADAGLSDGAYRLHSEAILWLYRLERDSCRIPKRMVPRFAGGDSPDVAAGELVKVSFWADRGDVYEVTHHAGVIRAGLAAQWAKRQRDLRAQHKRRGKDAPAVSGGVSADVNAYLTTYLPNNPAPMGSETNSHADSDERAEHDDVF